MKIALALESRLAQQGGTEVLVRELLRGLHPRFELVLVSADPDRSALPEPIGQLISRHLSWDPGKATASSACALAAAWLLAAAPPQPLSSQARAQERSPAALAQHLAVERAVL